MRRALVALLVLVAAGSAYATTPDAAKRLGRWRASRRERAQLRALQDSAAPYLRELAALPACPPPPSIDTSGWRPTGRPDSQIRLALPPAFERDTALFYVEGGDQWHDGPRTVERAWSQEVLRVILHAPNAHVLSACQIPMQRGGALLARYLGDPTHAAMRDSTPVRFELWAYDSVRAGNEHAPARVTASFWSREVEDSTFLRTIAMRWGAELARGRPTVVR